MDPEEAVHEELENIRRYNSRQNAFITIFDGEQGLALTRARELGKRLDTHKSPRSGLANSLYGVLLTLKDNLFFTGFPTTNGSEVYREYQPPFNATVVDSLLGAGLVPLGKTNQHELALGITGTSGHDGPIRNPVDPTRISGGSSGGSAVSVALAKNPIVSVGSDTGGSVRVPAALCGIIGFKPSHGVLSTSGVFPLSGSLDHVGLFTRSMEDLIRAFGVCRHEPYARPTTKRDSGATGDGSTRAPLRVGIPSRYFTEDMDRTVSSNFWKSIERLRARDDAFKVESIELEPEFADYSKARAVITLREAAWFYEPVLRSEKLRRLVHRDVLELMDGGLRTGMLRYMDALNVRANAVQFMDRLLRRVDVLLMPTCLITAPKIEDIVGRETGSIRILMLRNTELFNLCGFPALSVPMTSARGSLPCGLQIVGRFGADDLVLRAGASVSTVLDSGKTHP